MDETTVELRRQTAALRMLVIVLVAAAVIAVFAFLALPAWEHIGDEQNQKLEQLSGG